MTSRTIRRGQFYALAAMAIWSTNYILGRSLRDTLTPATISTVRAIMAGIPLATWVGARGEWPHPLRPFLGPFLGLGFLGIFASQYLTYLALHWSLATNVIILNAGSPLVTAALAVAAGVTPFSARLFGGLALSVAGAALVTALGASGGTRVQLDPGALLVVASMVTWGLYNLGVQRLSRSLPPLAITSGSMVAGLPFLLAALWIERPAQVWVSVWRNFPTLVYLALGPSAVAYACWSAAIRDLGAGYAMLFNNTLPVFGMVLGAVILHEPVTIVQVLASALIIGGIMVGFRSLALEVHTPPSGGSPGSRKSVGTPEEGPGGGDERKPPHRSALTGPGQSAIVMSSLRSVSRLTQTAGLSDGPEGRCRGEPRSSLIRCSAPQRLPPGVWRAPPSGHPGALHCQVATLLF